MKRSCGIVYCYAKVEAIGTRQATLRYLMLDDSNRDLPSQFLITNAEFSLDQLAKIRVALEDTAKIQSTPSGAKVKVGGATVQL